MIAILLLLKTKDSSIYMMVIFAVQGALFPIMALFLCVNAVRYREYIPLFIAGKVIGVFAILSWLLFSRQGTMIGGFLPDVILGSFDLFAIAAILVIKDDVNNSSIDNMIRTEGNTEVN